MSQSIGKGTSRREFLKDTGRLAAISAVTAGIAPRMYAGENNTIQLALIGCGGRGSGAAADALSVKHGPIKLVAMADAFENRLADSYKNLKEAARGQGGCARRTAGSSASTPTRKRWIASSRATSRSSPRRRPSAGSISTYAIGKNLNVFMEKPVTVDGPTSKRMLKLAEEASAKNLKVGVGLMSRHSRALQELAKRIQDGEIGDIILQRGYRMHGPVGFFSSLPKPAGVERTALPGAALPQLPLGQRRQLQRLLHSHHRSPRLDEGRMAGQGPGARRPALSPEPRGRHLRGPELRHLRGRVHLCRRREVQLRRPLHQRLQGHLLQLHPRQQGHCGRLQERRLRDALQHSTRARIPTARPWSGNPRSAPTSRIRTRTSGTTSSTPSATDKPYNEAKRGVEASLVTSMGRMAAHTGQEITFDEMLNCEHEMAPGPGQADVRRPRAAGGGRQRQVSRPAAGHRYETGVLSPTIAV